MEWAAQTELVTAEPGMTLPRHGSGDHGRQTERRSMDAPSGWAGGGTGRPSQGPDRALGWRKVQSAGKGSQGPALALPGCS